MSAPNPEILMLPEVVNPQEPKIPENAPKVEGQIHRLAYEFYKNLPVGRRSIQAVADEFDISRQAVGRWKKHFAWERRLEEAELASPLEADQIESWAKGTLMSYLEEASICMAKDREHLKAILQRDPTSEDYLTYIKNSKTHKDLLDNVIKVHGWLRDRYIKREDQVSAGTKIEVSASVNIRND